MSRKRKISKTKRIDDEDEDDWVDSLIKLGIGLLAIYFVGKLISSGNAQEEEKTCQNCGARVKKWARTCPVCRNNLIYPW